MENIVISAKIFNGYIVKYPMGSHLDFVATSYQALKEGLKVQKWSYKPTIYAVDTYYTKPKLRKLTSLQMKTIFEEIKMK